MRQRRGGAATIATPKAARRLAFGLAGRLSVAALVVTVTMPYATIARGAAPKGTPTAPSPTTSSPVQLGAAAAIRPAAERSVTSAGPLPATPHGRDAASRGLGAAGGPAIR